VFFFNLYTANPNLIVYAFNFISPTHKLSEERAPVWGYEFTTKAAHHRGVNQKPLLG